MSIEVWLTYLDNNYVSFESSTDDGITLFIHNYNLMNYKEANLYEALRDYVKDAKLDAYETIVLHYPIVKDDEYIKL